jgi:hypothetical protein
MKPAENKEMDLLLRKMAKQAKSVSDSGNGLQSAHLDADELSAFAECELPPAAQARYTTHLVDCGQCRKLVAQLSAAAGFPGAEVPAEAQPKPSFWESLPAFLSPAVFRFAVPALAMLAVITVGVITFRQQPSGDFVAQNQEPTQKPAAASAPASQPSEGPVQPQNQGSPATAANRANADSVKAGEKSGQVDKVIAAETSASDIPSATVAAKEAAAPPPPSKAGVEEQPTFAPEPSPGSRVQTGATREANKNEALAKDAKEKEDAAAGVAAQPAAAQQVRDDRGADQETSRSRKAAAAGRGGALNSVESRRAETAQPKRVDQDEVTREVSGHRFRKQGNAWVDLAYDGRSVTTVARGSEQYRALVADEPGINTIAQRFSGEVLIVWNGRAYRIR